MLPVTVLTKVGYSDFDNSNFKFKQKIEIFIEKTTWPAGPYGSENFKMLLLQQL